MINTVTKLAKIDPVLVPIAIGVKRNKIIIITAAQLKYFEIFINFMR